MKKRHWVLLAFLTLFGACTYRFLGGLRTAIYHGQVVDAESGKAIPEAVITVVWYREGIALESHPKFLLNAQEAVTDTNGRFSLQVSSGLDWNPLSTRADEPSIVVYKPGYEPLWAGTEIGYGFKGNQLVEGLETGAIIKLRTLEAANLSNTRYVDAGSILAAASMPTERIPHLMRAINLQRELSGLQVLPNPSAKGSTP